MRINELEQLGFSKKEGEVYLACLELGVGTAQKISKKAGLPKSTVADILKNLVLQGFVASTKSKSKTLFNALSPVLIEEHISNQLSSVKKLMPELHAMFNAVSSKPKIRFYDDKKGVEIALNELYKEAKELIFIGDVDAAYVAFPEYFPKGTQRRIERKIPTRGFCVDGPVGRMFKEKDSVSYRKTKIVSFPIPVTSVGWIWNDKLALFNTVGTISVLVIEHREIVTLIRSMFEMIFAHEPEVK